MALIVEFTMLNVEEKQTFVQAHVPCALWPGQWSVKDKRN
jgi:hypothetical protein